MKNNLITRRLVKFFMIFVCLSITGVSISGCTPLKKKFIRKKKNGDQKNKFIPVLEPVDYEKQVYSSVQQYSKAYSLWKIWQKDYLQSLESESSDKNQKYLIDKIIVQLEEMKMFIVDQKVVVLEDTIAAYKKIQEEYGKPVRMRDIKMMQRKSEQNGKKIRLNFSPSVLDEASYTSTETKSE